MPAYSGPIATSKHGTETPIKNWSSLIGIITAIIGNVLISFALNTQRYAHIQIDREYKFKHDQEAKKARKHLPKAIRNYGTAVRQEEAAEERARINAAAPGPGEINIDEEEHPLLQNGEIRRKSDDTLKAKEDDEGESNGRKSYLKSPWWWLGIVLMTVGEAGNFLAYGFAPASIVSPLGVVALVSNCLIAPLMLKERFRQRDFWGVLISIAGAVTVVLSANQNEEQLDPKKLWKDVKRWEFLVYVLITIILMGLLMFASPKYGQRTILIDLGLVGLFGGYTVLSTKGVASLLSASLYRAFTYPIFYFLGFILILSAIMQIRYLNRALQKFDSTQVIPVQFVLFTLSVIIGSAILYQDFRRTNTDHAVKFIVGCALTFSGVYLITSGRKLPDDDDETDSVHEQDQIRLIDEEAAPVDDEGTPLKRETEPDSFHVQSQANPRTPQQHSRASSQAPSIVVTPANESPPSKGSLSGLNHNSWISSTEHLDHNEPERPKTPISQSMPPAGESSETPFFTPSTTLHRPGGLHRTISSPGSPQTPTRRAPSPPKPDSSARRNISRFIPGPLMPPLSSSLSGIIAESLRRGEGSPTSIRAIAQRKKSLREANRSVAQLDGELPISAILPGSSSVQTQVSRTNSDRGGVPISQLRPTPQTLSGTPGPALSGSLSKAKGRVRSMSETLSGLMGKSRGKAPDEPTPRTNARNGSRNDNGYDDDDDLPDGRLP